MKAPFIIYPDLESLLEKMSTCHKNLEKSSTTKVNNIYLPVIHCLHSISLTKQKINLIVAEVKIV